MDKIIGSIRCPMKNVTVETVKRTYAVLDGSACVPCMATAASAIHLASSSSKNVAP